MAPAAQVDPQAVRTVVRQAGGAPGVLGLGNAARVRQKPGAARGQEAGDVGDADGVRAFGEVVGHGESGAGPAGPGSSAITSSAATR